MAPKILIFSIVTGANDSFEVKNIEIWAPTFFKHNNSVIATVYRTLLSSDENLKKAVLSVLLFYHSTTA